MPHDPHQKERTPATVQTAIAATGKKNNRFSLVVVYSREQEKIFCAPSGNNQRHIVTNASAATNTRRGGN
jgi:hypothetical protein